MVYIKGGRTSLPFFTTVLLCLTLFIHTLLQLTNAASVTYDHRALVIDGKRKILISASIHYPRSTPEVYILTFKILNRMQLSKSCNNIMIGVENVHLFVFPGQMWPDLIAKAKEGGVDVIETYVFWNSHEPIQGTVYIFLAMGLFLFKLALH